MSPDLVTLQLIEHSLVYASEEMGLAVRNAAYSPNIKERMDHSAAIFDAEGRLLAQAEHIPVHLGSLPWGLRNMIELCRRDGLALEEGSMVFANDPYVTGTHLNDVTVVAPIHHSGRLVAFAVNKAHHSDVGGAVPGSISMDATTLFEEGTVVEPTYLMRRGEFVKSALDSFASGSRTPEERRGDLRAQVGANNTGKRRVAELVTKYGVETFARAGEYSFKHSQSMMTKRLASIRRGTYHATEVLEGPGDTELKLQASVEVSKSGVVVDYEGTDIQVDYPLNAVLGVTISGVYYVMRTLTGSDIPANDGAFRPIIVRAPSGSVLNPTYPHPVGGGNVETSQRNADLVYRALAKAERGKVPAASGGSMNNVMMGGTHEGRSWAFYETIGVGLGGRKGLDGIDGIQCNMTNTMNTPIEEIEKSLPMLITKYEFRAGSSGSGEFRGGCGVVRRYRNLASRTTFTVLADRENHSPWGLNGGEPGARTEVVLTKGAKSTAVSSKATFILGIGDELELRTAGGGGYGPKSRRKRSAIEEDMNNGLVTAHR
ncbi:MAG: hydantoinase B/oxoprolinase family protein [Nitrososphaerales archaeon]|nr:hydantoinase B/oxoprolinase family protein [Nitrososphaerales archaeon]